MRQSFFGFNVALSGLYSAQRSLDVVNNNISNANTPGYSRQVAVQTAARPISLMDGTGMVGTGSQVETVSRIRDEYLDFKYWSENIANGEWTVKSELLSELEATFNEPSESGFATMMNEFFNAFQELAKDPSSGSVRALVREKAVTLTKFFNNAAQRFDSQQEDINDRVKLKVDEINSLASQIQQLNKQIYVTELDGNSANSLRDERTLLVDKLSKLANIQATEVSYGKRPNGTDDTHFVITLGGKPLVDHYNVSKLSLIQRSEKLNDTDVPNLYDIQWEDGNKLNISGGELKGLLDVRDGNDGSVGSGGKTTPIYKGVPYYQEKLNQFVQTFALAFNEGYTNVNGVLTKSAGHADGYGLDVDGDGPETASSGVRFFTVFGDGNKPVSSDKFMDGATGMEDIVSKYSGITAKNFTVSSDIIDNINKIATSNVSGENGNTNVLNQLLTVRTNKSLFYEGAPEDYMKSLVAGLGIDAQQADTFSSNQEAIVGQIDKRRMSVAGVSLDEEMSNLVRFQQAYNAAAKMISTMCDVYDVLINSVK